MGKISLPRPSDQVYDPLLGFSVSFNVPLGRAQGSMFSQHLNVSERATNSRDRSRCIGDECTFARVASTALQTSCPVLFYNECATALAVQLRVRLGAAGRSSPCEPEAQRAIHPV